MSEMLHRVARALREAPVRKGSSDDQYWLIKAQAALSAMQDPTVPMVQAGCESFGDLDMFHDGRLVDLDAITDNHRLRQITIRSWSWMINKALREKGNWS